MLLGKRLRQSGVFKNKHFLRFARNAAAMEVAKTARIPFLDAIHMVNTLEEEAIEHVAEKAVDEHAEKPKKGKAKNEGEVEEEGTLPSGFTDAIPPEAEATAVGGPVIDGVINFIHNMDPEVKKAIVKAILSLLGLAI